MSAEPITQAITVPEPVAASSENGLLIAVAVLVLAGVAAMLLMVS